MDKLPVNQHDNLRFFNDILMNQAAFRHIVAEQQPLITPIDG
jgi:hypothetical protein